MNESGWMVISAFVVFSSMLASATVCIAAMYLVWTSCSKASGIEAADRVFEAQASTIRHLEHMTRSAIEYADNERRGVENSQLMSAWLTKNVLAAFRAGQDGDALSLEPMPEPPDDVRTAKADGGEDDDNADADYTVSSTHVM